MAKPRVAFYWCASCGGCEEAVLDLDEKLLDVAAQVEIVLWPAAMDFKYEDVRALEDGGNVADAAVTAAAVLAVVEPVSCGHGGDAFALHHDAATGAVPARNGSGRSPRAAAATS